MAITMSYSCTCGYSSWSLQDAQDHANTSGHTVTIAGTLSPNVTFIDAQSIEERARQKALEAEIMRRARDKGLV